ncbi:14373_t:CDS:2 [Funneliformis geosporum]|uniref:14373_t:CDS:1 n=1 Tax=Funneliformis geosporum TaxID=1117311 RepID=A0A9W4SLE8_9GLOM|nr:14373_t:CDS:2 [Funneliformis geosporum]
MKTTSLVLEVKFHEKILWLIMNTDKEKNYILEILTVKRLENGGERDHVQQKQERESLVVEIKNQINELLDTTTTIVEPKKLDEIKLIFDEIISKLNKLDQKYTKLLEDNEKLKEEVAKLKEDKETLKQKIERMEQELKESKKKSEIMEQELKESKQKSEIIEQRNEIHRRFRDFVGRFLYIIATKLNFESIEGFCLSYRYSQGDKKKNLDEKLSTLLRNVGMKIEEFELLQQFKLKRNEMFHGKKRQNEDEARKMLKEMNFPDDMNYLKDPLNKALMALKTWK